MNASVCNIQIGSPSVVRSKPVHIERDGPWDEIRQKVTVYTAASKAAAITAAGAAPGTQHPDTDYPNFYVIESPGRKLSDWTGWEFDLLYLGTFDATKRQRRTDTISDQVSWSNETSGGLSTTYEMLIPRMTVSDVYVSLTEPDWSQQGGVLSPPNAPTPPGLATFVSDTVIVHVPHTWVLTSRIADEAGPLYQVNDSFTYFEQARPGNASSGPDESEE